MTLFTSLYPLTGSMRSLAISKLSQSTKGKGGKEGGNTGIRKNNKVKTMKLTKHIHVPATSQLFELHFTLFSVLFPLQVEIFHTAQ